MSKMFFSGPFSERYILLLLAAVIVLKGIFFFKYKTDSWKWSHFVYFDDDHIMSSQSMDSQQAKRVQNYFTKLIMAVVLVYGFAFLLETWMHSVQQ
ncbi:MAG: hypothetical protein JWQ40_1565 [Segetibacter sp.]|jgi:hypothetical protein|nr:hypothetical protein [Segetibacter sp.]